MPTRQDGTQPIISYGTVYLRPAERSDVPLFVTWMNDWSMSRTLGIVAPMSEAMEDQWFERVVSNQGKDGYHFTICLLDDDRPIGTIGLFELNLRNGDAGLGISIGGADDRGKGHGSDALRALLWFGFAQLRLERIWLDVYDMNPGARQVYERIGFVHEGTLRRAVYRDGAYRDVHRMAILVDEWRAIQGQAPAG